MLDIRVILLHIMTWNKLIKMVKTLTLFGADAFIVVSGFCLLQGGHYSCHLYQVNGDICLWLKGNAFPPIVEVKLTGPSDCQI